MRQIVLDTETTGLDHRNGDRVIEIGCVEMEGRKLTGRTYHVYINPEREVDPGAMAVHGISNEFLADKPKFAQIADEFIAFIRGGELIIHNASFDVGFLDAELQRLKRSKITELTSGVIDTLKMAREQFPGRKNSLDVLCDRLAVDNSHRTLHGALLDSELLADVYLAMTRGQESLLMESETSAQTDAADVAALGDRPPVKVLAANDEELVEHDKLLAAIDKESKGRCLWLAQPAA